MCEALFLDHGRLTYTFDTQAPYDYGTVATHSCNDGFDLSGNISRTCSGDGTGLYGTWTGDVSYCE